ncbi:MAG: hypothetical protein K9M49_08945 [Candidatus Marinimicrobia bacterium]|nr:hypothetical protein [Candidatus Neomarinimicrobiota bacterium]MCF7850421.1 hypothetical protein [Candidatus Neomarinimicrobiota bacterium]MCF7905262.1 hypothetical protein [Candidatus Neomarinimicrobiota bacterium]
MGRMVLIVVLGFIVIFGYVRSNLNRTAEEAMNFASEFTENAQLDQITSSAIEYALSIYLQTGAVDTTVVDSNWLEGIITVSITLDGQDTLENIDTVSISAVSNIFGVLDSSQVSLISRSLMIPPITASVGISSETSNFNFYGNVEVHGQDTNMDGTTGSGPELPGITVSSPEDSATIVDDYSGTNFIQGAGTEPSVAVSSDSTTDLSEIVEYYEAVADQDLLDCSTISSGSDTNPTIAYIDGDCELSGTFSGYGVLVVDGALTMRGKVRWHGIVLVAGASTMEFDASGTPAIYGGLLLSATEVNLTLGGTADLYYSSEAIHMVQEGLENSGKNRRYLADLYWWE